MIVFHLPPHSRPSPSIPAESPFPFPSPPFLVSLLAELAPSSALSICICFCSSGHLHSFGLGLLSGLLPVCLGVCFRSASGSVFGSAFGVLAFGVLAFAFGLLFSCIGSAFWRSGVRSLLLGRPAFLLHWVGVLAFGVRRLEFGVFLFLALGRRWRFAFGSAFSLFGAITLVGSAGLQPALH